MKMIEVLQGFPEDIVAFSAKGRITHRDYQDVLIPKVKEALARHKGIRCYYELGTGFSGMEAGAAWDDFKLGIEHLLNWKRVAVVTDVGWIRDAMRALRFTVPCEVELFTTTQAAEARKWICTD
jgi:hypothetical protein